MPSILALDISRSCGSAFFSAPDAAPKCATWPSGALWDSEDYGPYFVGFEEWLMDRIYVLDPDIVAWESPVVAPSRKGRGADENNVRRLVGVVAIAELVCGRRKKERPDTQCYEVNNQVCKAFVGVPGRRPLGMSEGQYKNLMVAAMTNRDFECGDDHQADACSVALVIYSDLGLLEE